MISFSGADYTKYDTPKKLADLYKYLCGRFRGMKNGGADLMTKEKNELVGWWRFTKQNNVAASDRACLYALYLMIGMIPFGAQFGTPTLSQFFDQVVNVRWRISPHNDLLAYNITLFNAIIEWYHKFAQ